MNRHTHWPVRGLAVLALLCLEALPSARGEDGKKAAPAEPDRREPPGLVDPEAGPVPNYFSYLPGLKPRLANFRLALDRHLPDWLADIQIDKAKTRRYIIIIPQAFEPDARVNPAGTVLALEGRGDLVAGDRGARVVVTYTVTQVATGASATGRWQTQTGFKPRTRTIAHISGRSPRFQPGPAVASATAKLMDRTGTVLRTWSWESALTLR